MTRKQAQIEELLLVSKVPTYNSRLYQDPRTVKILERIKELSNWGLNRTDKEPEPNWIMPVYTAEEKEKISIMMYHNITRTPFTAEEREYLELIDEI